MQKSKVKQSCCEVEAVVTVDSRGQIVLPKEIRKSLNISGNDKLALVRLTLNENTPCVVIMKTDALACAVSELIQPAITGLQK